MTALELQQRVRNFGKSVETSIVAILVSQLARLQLEKSEDLGSIIIRGQQLLTRLQEA